MLFPELKKENNFESNFRKPVFLRIYPGTHTVRVLGPTIHEEYSHYVNRATIRCIGDECPICQNNAKIRAEHPEDFRDVNGYSPRRRVFYTNVLDKTLVKKCTNCSASVNAINGNYPPACPSCQTIIVDVQPAPSNEVKILSRGVEFFELLNLVQLSTLDTNGEPLGLENYDVKLLVGSNKQPTPTAVESSNEPVTVDSEQLFDLENVIVSLTANEINSFLRGVSLRDIFMARSATKDVETAINSETEETSNEVQKAINEAKSLFS